MKVPNEIWIPPKKSESHQGKPLHAIRATPELSGVWAWQYLANKRHLGIILLLHIPFGIPSGRQSPCLGKRPPEWRRLIHSKGKPCAGSWEPSSAHCFPLYQGMLTKWTSQGDTKNLSAIKRRQWQEINLRRREECDYKAAGPRYTFFYFPDIPIHVLKCTQKLTWCWHSSVKIDED